MLDDASLFFATGIDFIVLVLVVAFFNLEFFLLPIELVLGAADLEEDEELLLVGAEFLAEAEGLPSALFFKGSDDSHGGEFEHDTPLLLPPLIVSPVIPLTYERRVDMTMSDPLSKENNHEYIIGLCTQQSNLFVHSTVGSLEGN